MNYNEAMTNGFLDELQKIAEDEKKKPQTLSRGQQVKAFLLGGPQGYYGAMKGAPHGEALEGGLRGFGGYALGGLPGQLIGANLGALLGDKISPGGMGALAGGALGGLGGQLAGGIAGYKTLTRKYNEPPAQ